MSKYIGKYSTEGALVDALFNGELSKPYVALVGNSLNYNEYGTLQSLTCSGQTTAQIGPIDEGTVLDVYGPSEWTLECATGTFNDTGLHTYAGSAKESVIVHFATNTGDTKNHTVTLTSAEGVASLTIEQMGVRYLPLTFEILEGGTFKQDAFNRFDWYFNVSLNGEEVSSHTLSFNLDVVAGDIVTLTANAPSDYYKFVYKIGGTASFNVYGNFMSIINADAEIFPTLTTMPIAATEYFKGAKVVDAGMLILPATTLVANCYQYMFSGCTSLTTAPALPATTLAQYCYDSMFYGCTSLTTTSELPATTLAVACYQNMFSGCISLTAAPALPATTLAQSCYGSMFYGCTSLTAAPALPATTLVNYCYNAMFYNCTSLNSVTCLATVLGSSTDNWLSNVSATGTFTKAAGVTWPTGEDGIPSGWEVVEA